MKRLLTTLKDKWPAYLLEIIVLVVGIYGAFALESWNENKQEREKEISLLLALKSEFEENIILLRRTIDKNGSNIIGANELASKLSPDASLLSEREVANLWDRVFKAEAIYQPGMGVVIEGINSGSISLIQNGELRRELSALEARLQELKGQEAIVLKFRLECYNHLRKEGSFRKILDYTRDKETWYQLAESQFSATNRQLLASRGFENDLMLFIGTSVYFENKFLKPFLSNLEQTLALIDSEIAK